MNCMKKYFYLLFLLVFAAGCAAVGPVYYTTGDLLDLDELCEKNGLKYEYSPFYEDIKIEGPRLVAVVKPGYSWALLNGELLDLGQDVVYSNGLVKVPSSLLKSRSGIYDSSKVQLRKRHQIRTIVIDAGHGGKDPGAVSKGGVEEKTINLRVARYLYALLKARGYRVLMTRDTDNFISLNGRTDFAKKHNADLFISIHSNSISKSSISGMEVYYLAENFTDIQARALAESERLGGIANLNGKSYNTRMKAAQILSRDSRNSTLEFCSLILKSASDMGIKTRSAKGAPFYVLKNNICPSVLVEIGYLTNPQEERMLTLPLYQKQLAGCLAFSVDKLDQYMAKISHLRYVAKR